jgi:hypothetical protein
MAAHNPIHKKHEHMYLDYVNNFVTVSAFAQYYGLTNEDALDVIDSGRANYARSLFQPIKK